MMRVYGTFTNSLQITNPYPSPTPPGTISLIEEIENTKPLIRDWKTFLLPNWKICGILLVRPKVADVGGLRHLSDG